MTEQNSTDLVLANLNKSLKSKSILELAKAKRDENVVLLLDCSSSMDETMRNGRKRITGLREVVREMEATRGELTMAAFGPTVSDNKETPFVAFVGSVPQPGGGTPLAQAIDFVAAAGAGRIVLVSDGEPNDGMAAMDAAAKFGGKVDVVFVGDAKNTYAREFLDELAKSTGGTSFMGDMSAPKELGAKVVGLLGDGSAV